MLNRTVDEFILDDGVDLLNEAINNAQRVAQNAHDFERSKVLVDLVIDEVAGGDLDNAYLHGGDVEADAVEIITIMEIGTWNDANTDICELSWLSYDESKQRNRSGAGSEYDPETRYPGDDTTLRRYHSPYFIVRGGTVLLASPGTSGTEQTIGLYVCKYFGDMPDPDENPEYENWLMKKGGVWLMWQAIVELNHINKHFVFRQEGNLMPPEKRAAEAWDALIKADTYQFNKMPEGHL